MAQDLSEGGGVAGLRERPRLHLVEVAVAFADGVVDDGKAAIQLHVLNGGGHFLHGGHRGIDEFLFVVAGFGIGGNLAVGVAFDHGYDAAGEVAEIVREFGIVAFDEQFFRERRVQAEIHGGHQEVAERIDAVFVDHVHGIDDVVERFAHLRVADEPPAVGENRLRHGQPHGMEHGGPEDGMRAEDVLSNQMVGGGPPCLEFRVIRQITDGGDIVDESVKPNVSNVIRVKWKFNTP